MNSIEIRFYQSTDYPLLKQLYQDSGWFDPQTDAEERILSKVKRDPESLLVACEGEEIVGTLSIIEDGRIALFFRVIIKEGKNIHEIRNILFDKGEKILLEREYKEVHIVAPEEDIERQKEYESFGFQKGREYRWMWKKVRS